MFLVSLIVSAFKLYFRLLKELFEMVFGIKLYRLFASILHSIVRFMKISLIAFHLVLIAFYLLYPTTTTHVSKPVSFLKNHEGSFYTFHSDESIYTSLLCSEFNQHTNLVESDQRTLLQRNKSYEELLLSQTVQQQTNLNPTLSTNDAQTEQSQQQQQQQQQQNYQLLLQQKREIEQLESRIKTRQQRSPFTQFPEIHSICQLQQSATGQSSQQHQFNEFNRGQQQHVQSSRTSTVKLAFRVLNLNPKKRLRSIQLNVLLFDRRNTLIPLRKEIEVSVESWNSPLRILNSSRFTLLFEKLLNKLFDVIGIDMTGASLINEFSLRVDEELLHFSTEIEALNSSGSGISSSSRSSSGVARGAEITAVIAQIEPRENDEFIVQAGHLELMPDLKGLVYAVFYSPYLAFIGMFAFSIAYLYFLLWLYAVALSLCPKGRTKTE